MNVKRFLASIVTAVAFTALVSAQFTGSVGEPIASEIGVDSAQQNLREISVTKFEDAGFWFSTMPRDQGITTLRRLLGGPADKLPITGEAEVNIKEDDLFVLGMKVQYNKRGLNTFALYPVRPIPVAGIAKTLSVWVVGRNMNHILTLVIEDFFGNRAELTMGVLNFTGWRQLTVAVPPKYQTARFSLQRPHGHQSRCVPNPNQSRGGVWYLLHLLR